MRGDALTATVMAGCLAITYLLTHPGWLREHVRKWHANRSADPIVRRRHALDALDRIHRKASR